jgi:hypothetical protein
MSERRAIEAALVLLIMIAPSTAQAEGASLAETLAWMDNTFNPHEHSSGHGRWETFSVSKPFQRRTTRFTYNGCMLTFSTNGGVLVENYQDTSSFTVNLKDVDPNSIRTKAYSSQVAGMACEAWPSLDMECDIAEMTFETRNQVPFIEGQSHFVYPELKGKDHNSYYTGKSFEAGIGIDDVKYAARFENAFRHAVTLCGGRPSAF